MPANINDVLRGLFGRNPSVGLKAHRESLGLDWPEWVEHVRTLAGVDGSHDYNTSLLLYPSAGPMVPPSGLTALGDSERALRHVVFYGDSIVQGVMGGGAGPGLVEQWTDQFEANNPSVTVQPGFQPIWRAGSTDPRIGSWTFVGGSGAVAALYNLGPFNPAVLGEVNVRRLQGAADVATWTRPGGMTISSVTVVYGDLAGTGNDGEVSVNGGSSWTPLVQDEPEEPVMRTQQFVVANPTDVRIRGNVGAIYGIFPNLDGTGVAVHNIGRGTATVGSVWGAMWSPTREWWHVFDVVEPELSILLVTNDGYGDGFRAGARDVTQRLGQYGDLVVVGQHWHGNPDGRNVGIAYKDADWRALAYRAGGGFFDLRARWGTNADAVTAGYMDAGDGIHPTVAGAGDIADAIDELLAI